jgi:uncharacterized protein (TIGR02246 family)
MFAPLLAGAAIVAVGLASPAIAQEEEIRAAMARWSEVYATAVDAAEMQALYHADAVFWGTGSREPMVGADAFGPYFQNQFDNFTDRAHAFVDPVVVFYGDGDVATSTGLYRFNVTPIEGGGPPIEVLYRYSFSYVLSEGEWLIIHQHSSQLP